MAFDFPGESGSIGATGTANDSLGFCGISGDAARLTVGTGSNLTNSSSVLGVSSGDTARLISLIGDGARLTEDCDDNGSATECIGDFDTSGEIEDVEGIGSSEITSASFISGLNVLSSFGSSGIGVLDLKSLSPSKCSMTFNGSETGTTTYIKINWIKLEKNDKIIFKPFLAGTGSLATTTTSLVSALVSIALSCCSFMVSGSSPLIFLAINLTYATRVVGVTSDNFGLYSIDEQKLIILFYVKSK